MIERMIDLDLPELVLSPRGVSVSIPCANSKCASVLVPVYTSAKLCGDTHTEMASGYRNNSWEKQEEENRDSHYPAKLIRLSSSAGGVKNERELEEGPQARDLSECEVSQRPPSGSEQGERPVREASDAAEEEEKRINLTEETQEEEGADYSERAILHRERDNKGEETISGQEEDPAPDGGWGWVVVLGASMILVLVDTVGQCFGIIFSTFLLELETPSTMTAWIFNMFGFLWCMIGPPLRPLVSEFGWRRVTFAGSVMLAVSTITSAFVTSPWQLFLTYSALGGIGCGIISSISYMIVPYYFTQRRGLANGIIMSWDCGGQLLGPPLIQHLQTVYGFTGSTLILGGIVLHCCVGAMVFHPVEWHLKPREREAIKSDNVHDNFCENGSHSALQSSSLRCRWRVATRLVRSTVADLRILGSARAVIIALGATFIFSGYLNFLAFVPFIMQESGFSLQDAAWCVSVSGMCNMLTRVLVSSLTDTGYFNYRLCYLIGNFTIAATMIIFVVVRDQLWLAVVMGVWGCGVGAFMSIFSLVMVHYMGLDNFMPMLGATMLCIAGGYLTIGPAVGYIRDASDSYTLTICVLAIIVLWSFLLWLFMPAAVAYDKRSSAKNDANNSRHGCVI